MKLIDVIPADQRGKLLDEMIEDLTPEQLIQLRERLTPKMTPADGKAIAERRNNNSISNTPGGLRGKQI